ncbi:glycosyltransferase family 2 protein [Oscillibacter valericigenes]|uniref:glycosyltransferase family 2 protein n=1 Tax=Oscillibacter valericigenes TaxID=351091 RepID=UPI001F308651|nr:glycosyltransferase family 2 protein [Oscillibacter valericigenes]MCF2665059.1 glycosyltransferase family 2 protein [Oscillibacter valericigenes]
MLVTIIVPCYNEEAALPYFLEAIQKTEAEMSAAYGCGFELLFVNDGSKDGTLSVLRRFAKEMPNVRYLSFSRNFGKEAAMYAGLREARGDYVVIMDADLQHPPAMLPEMYEGLQSGEYECVAARRESRKGEPPIRSFFARCFYKLINRISDTEIVDGACDFRMMTRQMVDAIVSMGEYNRFSKGIFGWVGFRTKWLPYENVERVAGETKWSFWKLLLYSLQGIVGFSTVPLAIASVLGILLCVVSFLMVVYIIVKTLLFGDPVSGWPSLACMVMFMGGIQLLCMGILGQYLAKTYLETKHRPIYILAETDKENPDGTKTD